MLHDLEFKQIKHRLLYNRSIKQTSLVICSEYNFKLYAIMAWKIPKDINRNYNKNVHIPSAGMDSINFCAWVFGKILALTFWLLKIIKTTAIEPKIQLFNIFFFLSLYAKKKYCFFLKLMRFVCSQLVLCLILSLIFFLDFA